MTPGLFHLRRHFSASGLLVFSRFGGAAVGVLMQIVLARTIAPDALGLFYFARAVLAFLKIETNGWKGKQGTALACDEKTAKFAMNAFTGDEANSICRADILMLNGAPIAVSLITLAGRTGFTVKCSYDEAYRSYSAGLLLEIEVIRSFLSENWASRLDSATAGTHVIDSLWPGRIEVADLIFSLSPDYPELRLSALQTSDQMRRKIRTGIKGLLMLLRRS
jgi:hypothetical protein